MVINAIYCLVAQGVNIRIAWSDGLVQQAKAFNRGRGASTYCNAQGQYTGKSLNHKGL